MPCHDLLRLLQPEFLGQGVIDGGRSIGPLDLLIAAQARSLGATLVTANAAEFKRVKGLKVLSWE